MICNDPNNNKNKSHGEEQCCIPRFRYPVLGNRFGVEEQDYPKDGPETPNIDHTFYPAFSVQKKCEQQKGPEEKHKTTK